MAAITMANMINKVLMIIPSELDLAELIILAFMGKERKNVSGSIHPTLVMGFTLKKRRHIWNYSDEKKNTIKYIFSFKNQA